MVMAEYMQTDLKHFRFFHLFFEHPQNLSRISPPPKFWFNQDVTNKSNTLP